MKKLLALLLIFTLLLSGCALLTGGHSKWQEQYDLGIRYLNEGNYQEAILAFEAAIKIDPKQADAYVKLSEVYMELGDYDMAMKVLKDGLDEADDTDDIEDLMEEVEEAMTEAEKTDEADDEDKAAEDAETEEDTSLDLFPNDTLVTYGTLVEETYEIAPPTVYTAYILELDEPFTTLLHYDGQESTGTELEIDKIQIGFQYDEHYIKNELLGKHLSVAGSVMYAHTGHHLTPVLLMDAYLTEETVSQDLSDYTYAGTCGDGITWGLNEDTGEFVIAGKGTMDDLEVDYMTNLPGWYEYADKIKTATIEEGVTYIGDETFALCSNLTSVTIADSVTDMGNHVFSNCKSLTSIKFGSGISTIPGGETFLGCSNLTDVTISRSITKITEGAFGSCKNLTDVYYDGTQEQWQSIEIGNYNDPLLNAAIHFE